MFLAGTPTLMRLSTMPETTSGADMMLGAPEQFTLTPTTSLGVIKRAQQSRSSLSPVSARIPSESMLRTTCGSTFAVASSMQRGEATLTTWPRYGPGMPGLAAGLKADTTLYFGISAPCWAANGSAALRWMNSRLCIVFIIVSGSRKRVAQRRSELGTLVEHRGREPMSPTQSQSPKQLVLSL